MQNGSIPDELRETAEIMRHELEQNRLRVALVPNPDDPQRMIRAAVEHNPEWYRSFCALYGSGRTRPRPKFDTLIKRAHTLRALGEIAEGHALTEYARRVFSFVVKEHAAALDCPEYELRALLRLAYPSVDWVALGVPDDNKGDDLPPHFFKRLNYVGSQTIPAMHH